MQPTIQPPSKIKVALMWLLMVGVIAFWVVYWLWRNQEHEAPEDLTPSVARAVFFVLVGGVFLSVGVVSYLAVTFTECFTFNFNRPMWSGLKIKIYLANIFVPLLLSLGLGFVLSAFGSPVLIALGCGVSLANLLPVLGMVGLWQIAQLWVLIWGPLERRAITRRLLARGLTAAQLQSAVLIGISNPTRSSFKKFGAVEEDVGALWVGPHQLVYWGDDDGFGITRDQLMQIERRADAGSTTILCGITHVILHVRLPDGSERKIRLHTEGLGTMGRKRRAMDQLADAIVKWHSNTVPASAA